jgi:2-methylcitrate dehydratase PrpD
MSATSQAVSEQAVAAETTTISQTLARFTAELQFEDIPAAVRERAKHLILDSVGTALASTRYEYAHRTLTALQGLAGAGDSAVIGLPARLPLRDAVLLNGVLVHGLDYDDTHLPGIIHATASIFPTVLGAGEHTGASGEDLLTAYVAGMEAATRLATTAKGGFHEVGFHPTGLVGAFGCALAAGRLFGLTEEQLTMAQGITLSTASGAQEFLQDGAWTKRMHPGWAGQAAITNVALARQGFIGPKASYEGRYGLYNTHMHGIADQCDYSIATRGLKEQWEIDVVSIKPFPVCHFVHGCADAALALVHEQGLKPENVAHIRALIPAETMEIVGEPKANKQRPVSDYDAKFSVQFVVAACLSRGRFGLAELLPGSLSDPAILALAQLVEYGPDPDTAFPQAYSGEVIVETKDGRTLRHREQINRGAAERPISNDEIVEKFNANAALACGPDRVTEIRDLVLSLDRLPDAAMLAEGLAAI